MYWAEVRNGGGTARSPDYKWGQFTPKFGYKAVTSHSLKFIHSAQGNEDDFLDLVLAHIRDIYP